METTNKKLYRYFGLTFFVSWILWSPLYFSKEVSEMWALPGAWGPTLAAIILTWIDHGKSALKRLFSKILIWKVPIGYYVFAVAGIAIIGLLSITTNWVTGGDLPKLSLVLNGMGLEEGDLGLALLLLPLFYLINTLVGGPIAEELGWRGYAQELIQTKYNPNVSGLLIGFMWSIWHLPLFIYLPQGVGSMPIWAYIPLMTAMGVLFSWLYNKTRGSLLLAILFHGGMNFAHGFLGADVFADVRLLSIHVVWIIILVLVLSRRNKDYSESLKGQGIT